MARTGLGYIIKLLRLQVNDATPISLASNEYYAGDTIKLQNTYKNLSDVATDPDDPTVTITTPDGTVAVDATPTQSATGVYFYNYAPTAIEGYWKVVFGGSISNAPTLWSDTFRVLLTERFAWTDDELQKFLDLNRRSIRRELLTPASDRLEFSSAFQLLEGTSATDAEVGASWDNDRAIIKLWSGSGSGATAITPATWNLVDGVVGFDSEQSNSVYMDARRYVLNGAIAMCYDQLASDPTRATSWSRGSVSYTFSDFQQMAQSHRNLMGAKTTRVNRVYR